MVNQFAKHIKAFDSYPGINLTQGNYALSQVWNGDARAGLLAVEEAGKDPSKYTWGLGAPKTELWMDNWTIVKGAKHLDAAYDFINYILDPDNSEKELAFHGYNTGVKGIEEKMADAKYKDLVFFSPEQVKTMEAQEINTAQDRQVEIYNKTKAAAGA
jgi:spermidine/putrescine transport system substrate-binding protein